MLLGTGPEAIHGIFCKRIFLCPGVLCEAGLIVVAKLTMCNKFQDSKEFAQWLGYCWGLLDRFYTENQELKTEQMI